ncbi:hypothetical protein NDU88_002684 [Pleurodeles waltl]|uniref:Uncharacterized protein n=1 Tax=Pleurodeles waltl TaxID=8319 RepID=A0AAV7KWT7_PLEWA|nr:hypothetical protein NDU88_002684 [Pleurodeles waltl]
MPKRQGRNMVTRLNLRSGLARIVDWHLTKVVVAVAPAETPEVQEDTLRRRGRGSPSNQWTSEGGLSPDYAIAPANK